MEHSITVNGTKMDSEREKERRFGKMAVSSSDTGKKIRLLVKVA
jgi:hypothetical protein